MNRLKTLVSLLMYFAVLGLSIGVASATDIHADLDVLAGEVDMDVTNTAAFTNFNGKGSFVGDIWITSAGSLLDTRIDVVSRSVGEFSFAAANALSGATDKEFYVNLYAGGGESSGMHCSFSGDIFDTFLIRSGGTLIESSGTSDGQDSWGYLVSMGAQIRDRADPENVSASASLDLRGDGSGSIDHIDQSTTMYFISAASGKSSLGNGLSVSDSAYGETHLLYVNATGPGEYSQSGYGENSLYYNGMNMRGGGSMTTTGDFNDGFSFNPEVAGE